MSVNKVTSADCKQFLVDCFKNDPKLLYGRVHVSDLPIVLASALNAKNWKRDEKINPNKDNDYTDAGDSWDTHYGGEISGAQLKSVRKFYLDPNKFDSAVCWMVLEDIDGKLILGEDWGD